MSSVPKLERLTPELERTLTDGWKAGNREAGQKIIEAYVSYVIAISREYQRWGTPLEDIVQQGNIGLLEASRRFDPDRGYRLVTFAQFYIRAEIREYVLRNHRMVRVGSSKAERRAVRFYRKTFVKDPATLAAYTGLSERRAQELMPILAGPEASIDPAPSDHGIALGETLADATPSPEELVCHADELEHRVQALQKAFAELSQRERQVLERHLMSDEPETLAQIGVTFGVTKERMRQVEEGAKKRMRGRLQQIAADVFAP